MTDKPQPAIITTATAPPVQGETEKLVAAGLSHWEARLVVKARQLRTAQNRAMLIAGFEGPAMSLWRADPFIGKRCDMILARVIVIDGRSELALLALIPEGRVTE